MSTNMLNGAQVIVDYLIQEKVPYVFGLCGHGNIQFIDALFERKADIKTVSVHHESVAGFMADVYYRVSGQPTATFTSCGPGSANLPISLGNAFLDSVPFMAVTGNVPTSQFNRGAFQELYRHYQADFPSTVRSYCKKVFQPTRGEMVPLAVRQAWKTMVTGRPGPVVLDVPFDVFMEAAAEEAPRPEEWRRQYLQPLRRRSGGCHQGGRHAARRRAAGYLRRSGRALGRCLRRAAATGRTAADPGSSIGERARRHRHPSLHSHSGWSRAAATTRPITRRVRPTYCWRSAYASTTAPRARGSRATHSPFRRPSSSMSTSIRRRSVATIPVALGLMADVRTFLRQVHAELDRRADLDERSDARKKWLRAIDGYRKEWDKLVAPGFTDDSKPINPQRAAFEIDRGLPDDAILVSDIGVHHNWLLGLLQAAPSGFA